MTLPVIVTSAAQIDIDAAADHYEALLRGLGDKFIAVFGERIAPAGEFPLSFPSYYRDLRKVGLRPFPFLALYRTLPEFVQVVAIIDARRDPSAIRRQLDNR